MTLTWTVGSCLQGESATWTPSIETLSPVLKFLRSPVRVKTWPLILRKAWHFFPSGMSEPCMRSMRTSPGAIFELTGPLSLVTMSTWGFPSPAPGPFIALGSILTTFSTCRVGPLRHLVGLLSFPVTSIASPFEKPSSFPNRAIFWEPPSLRNRQSPWITRVPAALRVPCGDGAPQAGRASATASAGTRRIGLLRLISDSFHHGLQEQTRIAILRQPVRKHHKGSSTQRVGFAHS